MEAATPLLKGSVVVAVMVGCALVAACGAPSGAGVTRQSRAEATQKSAFVFDAAPNETVAAGDKALAEKNYSVALQRYEEGAKDANEKVQGSALNRLGELYDRGLGVDQDWMRSFDLYQKSATLDNPYGAANLGNALFFALGTDRDLKEALRWALKGAEGSVPMAINQLGWQYRTGMGVPVDTAEARRRYQRSAELGDATGESQLGWMYAHVEPLDYQLAMEWYKKAAAQNEVTSENNIGFLYEKGLGVAQDYAQAAAWYQKAAALNYPRAQYHLGYLYALGHGVPLDQKRARELIGKAGDAGDEDAGRWLSTH